MARAMKETLRFQPNQPSHQRRHFLRTRSVCEQYFHALGQKEAKVRGFASSTTAPQLVWRSSVAQTTCGWTIFTLDTRSFGSQEALGLENLVDQIDPFRLRLVWAMPLSKRPTAIDAIDNIHGCPSICKPYAGKER